MTDRFPNFGAFDPASVSEVMQRQFGWGDADVARAAEALMPAALAGMRRYAASPSAFEALLAFMPGPGRVTAMPGPDSLVGEPLALIFGPAEVQRSVARYVSEQTGLELPGIETMMPVVATLALGQAARRFTVGPARELLDAFLAGYARGRPKPVPNPMRMMAPYTEAMRSFWDGYLGLFDRPAPDSQDAAVPGQAPPDETPASETPASETGAGVSASDAAGTESVGAPAGGDTGEGEGGEDGAKLVETWLSFGRDIQEQQIRGFEALFDRASERSQDS
ncbi:DUF937 domain-containing protein [Stappia sp.]|uniref:DUF937 domain-containing protein n=1 Tax=Stappia sp. TaxID=1870903 RepID=UPI003A99014E